MTEKTASTEAQPKSSRRLSPYMMIWIVLTGLSIVYLALLATNPTMVANALGSKAQESEQQAQATAMLMGEVQHLRETVTQLSTDLQALKVDVTSGADRERDLLERVAALESPMAAETQKVATIAQVPPKAPAAPVKAQKIPGQLGAPQQTAAATPAPVAPAKAAPAKKAPAAAPQVAHAPESPPVPQLGDQFSLETGSVAVDQPVNFGPATVTPAQPQAGAVGTTVANAAPTAAPAQPKSVGIQIASGPSVQSLRLSWTLLSERHGAQLSRYQPRYTVGATEQGVTYDLVVGPFANANEARQVCAELAASATPCSLQAFRGDAL